MDERLLDIAEVAARTGLAPSALRFYERAGLLEPAGRNGQRRTYRPEAVDRVALILNARATGFALAELRDLLRSDPETVHSRLLEKSRELDQRIDTLVRARDRLGHALTCRHRSPLTCPTLLAGLRDLLPGAEPG